MRHLLAALAALCLFPTLVLAAALPATPATLAAVRAKAVCGDTIVLSAEAFGPTAWPARDCTAAPLTIDARAASLTQWSFVDARGLVILGGEFRPGQNATGGWTTALAIAGVGANADGTPKGGCAGVTVRGAKVTGPFSAVPGQPFVAGQGNGLDVRRCIGVEIAGVAASGLANGFLVGSVRDLKVAGIECEKDRIDCIQLANVWNAQVSGVVCHATLITAAEHPDCVQMYSITGLLKASDVTIEKVECVGRMQCVFTPQVDRLLIRNSDLAMGGGNAIAVGYADQVRIEDNRVRTLASAPYKASINLYPGLTNVSRCGNEVDGVKDPPCPGAVTAEQVAALQQQLAALSAKAAEDQAAAVTSAVTSATTQLQSDLSAVRAALASAKAKAGEISALQP